MKIPIPDPSMSTASTHIEGISEILLGPLWFLIRNDPKIGHGPTLEGWCLYQTCPTGTSNWDKHNLSQWDRQIGTSCACPSGTSTACPNWDWERSKETSPCPMGQVIYPRWRPFLVPGQALYPRWSLSQFHLSQLVPQSGSTRPWNFWSTGQQNFRPSICLRCAV